jgi:hypothetical protein
MSEMRRIRVIIADDQELVRAGFSMVIGSQADMQVVAQANDGAQAVALSETLHPDVVLMDVRMPGMDGIEATRRISAMNTVPPNPDDKVQNDDCDPHAADDACHHSHDFRPRRIRDVRHQRRSLGLSCSKTPNRRRCSIRFARSSRAMRSSRRPRPNGLSRRCWMGRSPALGRICRTAKAE